jgi:hypothetical protein
VQYIFRDVLVLNNDKTNNGQVLWMFASFAVHQFGVIKFGKRVGPTANFETFAAALATGYQIVFGVSRHLCCLWLQDLFHSAKFPDF